MIKIQLQVMDQTTGIGGIESCGYHTLKNSLLNLLYLQGKISEKQFEVMLKDPNLFRAVFDKTKKANNDAGNIDVTLPRFVEILKQANAGEFDFSAVGISRDVLQTLNLTPNGNQDISVVNTMTGFGLENFEYATLGMEDDLFAAAAVAKIARHKGAINHVFAVGINNEHWVSASLEQNSQGERTWRFMDSWRNQSRYKENVIKKIEAVFEKNETQLQNYLVHVYENSSDLFNRRYDCFFDNLGVVSEARFDGFGIHGDKACNAKEYFVDDKLNLDQFSKYIENRFSFIQTVGWLQVASNPERKTVERLYHLTKFITDNADKNNPIDAKILENLFPICAQLKTCLNINKDYNKPAAVAEEPKPEPVPEKPTFQEEPIDVKEEPKNPAPHDEETFIKINISSVKPMSASEKESQEFKPRSLTDEERQEPKVRSASETEAENDFRQNQDEEEQQTKAAQFATQNQKPKATERFANAVVRAINSLARNVKKAFSYVADGIKSVF